MLNLTKPEITEKVKLSLTKRGVPSPKACNVKAFLDVSGSFKDEWEDGIVAKLFSRVLGTASSFDDDGDVPLYLFHNSVMERGIVNFKNLPDSPSQFAQWLWKAAGSFQWGGTEFAPILRALLPTQQVVSSGGFLGMFGKKQVVQAQSMVEAAADPMVVYILTDGDAADYSEARALAKQLEDKRIYVMFVNVSQMATCARRLSDEFDHVGHVYFPNLDRVSDEEIIGALMTEEFLRWRDKY